MATTATIASADASMSANVAISQDPSGVWVVDIAVTTVAAGNTVVVRVNGEMAWRGLPAEAAGG